MDRLKIKKNLYAGMGDFARQKRAQDLRKKYAAAPPAMAEQFEKEDAAVDNASLPESSAAEMKTDAAMMPSMDDVDSGAAQNKQAIEDAMAEMARGDEEEEDKKWMAKQRGS